MVFSRRVAWRSRVRVCELHRYERFLWRRSQDRHARRPVLRQLAPPIVAGRPAGHLERASRERVSALGAAVQDATVKGLVREMKDPAHDVSADRAIEQYWNGAGEQVLLDGGAQIEKNPAVRSPSGVRGSRSWKAAYQGRAAGRTPDRRWRRTTVSLPSARRIWKSRTSPS